MISANGRMICIAEPATLALYNIPQICTRGVIILCYINTLVVIVVVREDCQARKLNKEDAVDRCKWRKVIIEVR